MVHMYESLAKALPAHIVCCCPPFFDQLVCPLCLVYIHILQACQQVKGEPVVCSIAWLIPWLHSQRPDQLSAAPGHPSGSTAALSLLQGSRTYGFNDLSSCRLAKAVHEEAAEGVPLQKLASLHEYPGFDLQQWLNAKPVPNQVSCSSA